MRVKFIFREAPTGTAANDFLAARGDCALVAGALPSGCTKNADGSIQEGSPTNLVPEAGNDTARNLYEIHENVGLIGATARPTDQLRITADLMFGYNDNSFTRIKPPATSELQDSSALHSHAVGERQRLRGHP